MRYILRCFCLRDIRLLISIFIKYSLNLTLRWKCRTGAAPSCDIFNLGFIIFQCPLTTVHHLYIVAWPTVSYFADWSKRCHVTFIVIEWWASCSNVHHSVTWPCIVAMMHGHVTNCFSIAAIMTHISLHLSVDTSSDQLFNLFKPFSNKLDFNITV